MLRRNVLIFHSGALGDFILTWPIALAVARVYAQSRVFYVIHSEKGRLAERVLRVESRDAESGWQHLFGDTGKLPDPVRNALRGAQLVLNFVAGDADPWTTNVRDVSEGAELVTLRPRPPEQEQGKHVTDFLLAQLATHRILHPAVDQMLHGTRDNGIGAVRQQQQGGDGPIVIHPGSGSRDKCWPVPRWLDLIARLRAAGRPVRVLFGEVELERMPAADRAALAAAANDARTPATYLDLLDQLADARLFIGNDSGPGHLAAIIGTPTLCLFGPTDPAVWRPLGPRVATLCQTPIGSIAVDEVVEKAEALLDTALP